MTPPYPTFQKTSLTVAIFLALYGAANAAPIHQVDGHYTLTGTVSSDGIGVHAPHVDYNPPMTSLSMKDVTFHVQDPGDGIPDRVGLLVEDGVKVKGDNIRFSVDDYTRVYSPGYKPNAALIARGVGTEVNLTDVTFDAPSPDAQSLDGWLPVDIEVRNGAKVSIDGFRNQGKNIGFLVSDQFTGESPLVAPSVGGAELNINNAGYTFNDNSNYSVFFMSGGDGTINVSNSTFTTSIGDSAETSAALVQAYMAEGAQTFNFINSVFDTGGHLTESSVALGDEGFVFNAVDSKLFGAVGISGGEKYPSGMNLVRSELHVGRDVNLGGGSSFNLTDSLVTMMPWDLRDGYFYQSTLRLSHLNSKNSVIELWDTLTPEAQKSGPRIYVDGSARGETGLSFKRNGSVGEKNDEGVVVVQASNNDNVHMDPRAFFIHPTSDGYRNDGSEAMVVGAYDYILRKGSSAPNYGEQSWYLTAELSPPDAGGPNLMPDHNPAPPLNPNPNPNPNPAPDTSRTLPAARKTEYRAEVGGYFANEQLASQIQHHKWQDRRGQTNQPGTDSVGWARIEANKSSFDNEFGSRRKTTTELAHFGTDLLRYTLPDDNGRIDVGVMGLVGKGKTTGRGGLSQAEANVDSYNAGLYATWQQFPATGDGAYFDTWVMQGWNDNSVKGEGIAEETYHSKTTSASFEFGNSILLSESEGKKLYVQPQAQFTYSQGKNKDIVESTLTEISWDNKSQTTTRLGARLYAELSNDEGLDLKPFTELNYLLHSGKQSMKFDADHITDKTPRHAVELSLGLQGQVNDTLDLWAKVSGQKGQQSFQEIGGQIGATLKW